MAEQLPTGTPEESPCGCAEHPIGKPWGWNHEAWERHWDERHPLPEQPPTKYRDEDFG